MNLQDFTKKKKIIKSIRFELKPVGNTRETLEKNQIIQSDTETKELAAKVKIAGDCFYRDLIQSFAEECTLDCWDSLGAAYETSREDAASYRKASDNARSQFLKAFIAYCSQMDLSGAKFVENTLRDYVKNACNEDYDRNLMLVYINQLKGKVSASFKPYFASWERIIFGDKRGSVAARTLENFELYCSNMVLFRKIKEQCPEIVRTMSANFDIQLFEDYKKFNICISQTGIQAYNELISGRYDNAGNCIASGINVLLNEARQSDSSIHVHKFATLKKQILSKQEKAFSIDTIDSVDSLKDTLQYVLHQSDVLSNALNLFATISKRNITEIYICGASLSSVSAQLFYDHSILPDNILEEKEKELLKEKAASGKKSSLTEKENTLLKNSLRSADYSVSYVNDLICKSMPDKQINICTWILYLLLQALYVCYVFYLSYRHPQYQLL